MEEAFFFILEKITGRALPRKNKLIKSPFRGDRSPSFAYFLYQGIWFFKDFATGEAGTAIHLYCKAFNIPYKDAIRMLEKRWEVDNKNIRINDKKIDEVILTSDFEFNAGIIEHSYYQQQVYIDKEILELNKVYQLGWFMYRNRTFENETIVLYDDIKSIAPDTDSACKVYMPEKKQDVKFLGNRKWHHIFGINSISYFNKPYVFICAGEKDTLVVQNKMKAPAICFNSETWIPNNTIGNWLKSMELKQYYIIYDNDDTGRTYSKKLHEALTSYNIPATVLSLDTNYKDVTEAYIHTKELCIYKQ